MSVERQLALEPKRVARTEPAGDSAELFTHGQYFIPYSRAGLVVAGNVNLEAILGGISRTGDQYVSQSGYCAARDPVKFNAAQVGIGKFAEQVHALRPLDRDLRELVREIFDFAVELTRIVANPIEILFSRPGIDHQQIFLFAEAMHDDVVNESALRIKQG